MPPRCVITGKTREETDLVARPMVFVNKDESGERHARSIETQYEQPAHESFSTDAYINGISNLNGMARPFDMVMPYFISADLFEDTLHCWSVRSEIHLGYCSITLPAVTTAVAWLAAVNGTANASHRWLERQANTLSCAAWIRLPSKARDRISAWCTFQPGEQFLAYARHMNCSPKETGLGGVLVTNRRLVFNMFRKHIDIPLNQPCLIRVRPEAAAVHLSVGTNGGRVVKLGPINMGEAALVFEALEEACDNLTVETALNEDRAA